MLRLEVSGAVRPLYKSLGERVNNFTTNEDIATEFEGDFRHFPLRFSHNERTLDQISFQNLHSCNGY